MDHTERESEFSSLFKKKTIQSINKKLLQLKTDVIRGDTESRIAVAAYRSNDSSEATSLVATIFAGIALVVAVGRIEVGTSLWVLAVVCGAVFLLGLVHMSNRDQEAANAVLHYRITHSSTMRSEGEQEKKLKTIVDDASNRKNKGRS